jgi:hypothetical protein
MNTDSHRKEIKQEKRKCLSGSHEARKEMQNLIRKAGKEEFWPRSRDFPAFLLS